MDHPVLSGQDCSVGAEIFDWWTHEFDKLSLEEVLKELKQVAYETNKEWAERLGINQSKQLSLIKPSGTVSTLAGTSSGIHPRYAPFYLRRVTQDNKDPLTEMMKDSGIPHCIRGDKTIFSFPIKAPEGSVCARDMGALKQLELWKVYREYWCDGNPSQTIYYTDDEFLEVQAWVWKNWDQIGGLSFFPLDDYIYDREAQPFLEVTEEEYLKEVGRFPENIYWESLSDYEDEESITKHTEYACQGGNCEI